MQLLGGSKVRPQSRFSFRVRMKRSAQPLPYSGSTSRLSRATCLSSSQPRPIQIGGAHGMGFASSISRRTGPLRAWRQKGCPLTRDLLGRVGEGLYGPNWNSALAQDMRDNRRALQRWAAGDTPMPRTLRRDLARLVAARQKRLGALYRELSAG